MIKSITQCETPGSIIVHKSAAIGMTETYTVLLEAYYNERVWTPHKKPFVELTEEEIYELCGTMEYAVYANQVALKRLIDGFNNAALSFSIHVKVLNNMTKFREDFTGWKMRKSMRRQHRRSGFKLIAYNAKGANKITMYSYQKKIFKSYEVKRLRK
jgi:hypothetical protein